MLIFDREVSSAPVEDLDDADDLSVLITDGLTQDRARLVSSAVIDLGVKAVVAIGVADIDGFAALGDPSSDAVADFEADLADAVTLNDLAPQIAFLKKEECRAVCVHHQRDFLHDDIEQFIQRQC